MSGVLKMPRMGETMDEGKLLAWLVEPGQPFKRGDAILEVETDKTIVEYPALGDGTLVESLVEIGEMVEVGTPIAKIDVGEGPDWINDGTDEEQKAGSKDASKDGSENKPQVGSVTDSHGDANVNSNADSNADSDAGRNADRNADRNGVAATAATKNPNSESRKLRAVDTGSVGEPTGRTHNERQRATPLARRIAKEANLDLSTIEGTGRRGRIERSDVEAAAHAGVLIDLQTAHGIAWSEKGVDSGKPILFIHGFAADHSAWSGLQSQLARSGHKTIAVDLPSHGLASQDAQDISELAQPVIKLAEQKIGWQPVNIVAHSMGALVAVAVAQSVPTASLTLIAPAGIGRTINTNFLDALAKPRDVASVARTLTSLTHGPTGLSEAAHAAIYATLAKGRLSGIAQSLAGASGQTIDIRHELTQIAQEIPVSLLLGHRDQVINWSEALDVSPLIAVHHFPDAGHMPHWEALPQVQSILERKVFK